MEEQPQNFANLLEDFMSILTSQTAISKPTVQNPLPNDILSSFMLQRYQSTSFFKDKRQQAHITELTKLIQEIIALKSVIGQEQTKQQGLLDLNQELLAKIQLKVALH